MDEQQSERHDILRLASAAGLQLPPDYEAELVEAYAHIRRLIARLPQPREGSREPGHIFDPTRLEPTTD